MNVYWRRGRGVGYGMSARSGFSLGSGGYNRIARSLQKVDEALLVRVFHEADENRKGYLNRDDIKVAMVEIFGYKPSKYEIQQMFDEYGEDIPDDNVKGIPLEKFVACMSEKLVKQDEDEEIRHTFMAFDAQCRGFLTVDDLKKVFKKVAPYVPEQTIHTAFREIDQDGDGRVAYKDFDFLMKYSTTDHL